MYTEFYGLSDEPFALNPDPRFFFSTRYHKDVLNAMIHGVTQGRGFILLTGEEGTGKTTFLQQLVRTLGPDIKAISVDRPPETFDQLLGVVLLSLKLPLGGRGRRATSRKFLDRISRGAGEHEDLAIIVDNAQELSKEFLEEWSKFRRSNPERLPWVFAGRPEIEDKLNSWDLRQLKKGRGVRCRLQRLTEEESRQYIEHRLHKAGGHIGKIFTPGALSLICRHSEGSPGTIHTLCTQALWAGASFSKNPIDSSSMKETLEDSGILPRTEPGRAPFVEKLKARLPAHRVKNISFSGRLYDIQKFLYGEAYGFAKNPFNGRPDAGFYFATENCREVWNALMYGILRRKKFILLTGESGVGKTTLLALIFLYLSTREQKTVIPIFRSPDNSEEILQTLLRNLGVAGKEESKNSMLSRMNEELSRRALLGETVTIIIDEAQNLKKEILEEILLMADFHPKTPDRLQLIFVGDRQFERKLNTRDLSVLDQRFEVRARLLPFTPAESRDYIEYRLQRAGSTAAQVLTPKAMNLIAYHSSGIPRVLNQVCYEALSVGFNRLEERVNSENVKEALVNLGLEK